MKIDDNILREILLQKMAVIKRDFPRSIQKDVEKWMAEKYRVKYSIVVDIFNDVIPVESVTSVSYDMLFKLMHSIKDGCGDKSGLLDLTGLDEKTYFTEIEISEYSKPTKYEDSDTDIEFIKFTEIKFNKFSTVATVEDIIRWRNIGKTRYNPETQRDLITIEVNGISYNKTDTNKRAVESMYHLMEKGEFECDDIYFNINTDINTTSDTVLRVEKGKLIVPQKAKMDTLDGWHRLQAICMMKDNHPEWTDTFGIKIVAYSTEKANDFILSQDIKNHLTEKQKKRKNRNDEVNYIFNTLKADSGFHLRKTLTNDSYEDIYTIINDIFDPTYREESFPILVLIKENINNLVEKKKYFDKTFSKEEWLIYLYILHRNPDDFMEIVDNIDLENLEKQVKFKKNPQLIKYKILDEVMKEVIKDGE